MRANHLSGVSYLVHFSKLWGWASNCYVINVSFRFDLQFLFFCEEILQLSGALKILAKTIDTLNFLVAS